MLKKIRGLFLGLMVLAGSACVTPTHASSAPSVIMVRVQAGAKSGAPSAALQEVVVLYNQSSAPVDISGWCLVNKSGVQFACFVDSKKRVGYTLPAYGYAAVTSHEYIAANIAVAPDPLLAAQQSAAFLSGNFAYEATSQSSGSIVGGGDALRLIDASSQVIDARSWTTSLAGGASWARVLLFSNPDTYALVGEASSWKLDPLALSLPEGSLGEYDLPDESEPPDTPDSSGEANPAEGEDGSEGEGVGAQSPPQSLVRITEVLANPKGVDTGGEFIELHNTGSAAVSLGGLYIRLGEAASRWLALPVSIQLEPGEYRALYNEASLPFTLTNTSGYVQLYYENNPVGEPVIYASPKDDYSWALIGDAWQYIKPATPGRPNVDEGSLLAGESLLDYSAKTPCRSDQFRNEETGRCKLIATSTAPTPCKSGYERNAETGRCRKVVDASGPEPCKEGYERNVETNRCRKIVKMINAAHALKNEEAAKKNQPSWYYWGGIGLVVLLVLGYGVWEWRQELLAAGRRVAGVIMKP